MLESAGWQVQARTALKLVAALVVAVWAGVEGRSMRHPLFCATCTVPSEQDEIHNGT